MGGWIRTYRRDKEDADDVPLDPWDGVVREVFVDAEEGDAEGDEGGDARQGQRPCPVGLEGMGGGSCFLEHAVVVGGIHG